MMEVVCIPLMLLFHELGHYVLAKKRGIYKGYGFLPNPHIKLTTYFPHRMDYLSGFAFSVFPIPLWIVLVGASLWYWYVFFMLGAACLDFVVLIFYGKLPKRGKH